MLQQTLEQRADRWLTRRQDLEQQVTTDQTILEKARIDLADLKACVALAQFVAAEVNKNNEEQTATLTTLALRETFTDHEMSLILEHINYRGQPGVLFHLRDERTGVQGDPMEAFAGGHASLVGIILMVISVVRQPGMARVLILDEPMVQVSEIYHEAAGKLLRKLCDPPPRGLGFKMLVITHEYEIARQAHKIYHAQKSTDGRTLVLREVSDPSQLEAEFTPCSPSSKNLNSPDQPQALTNQPQIPAPGART